MQVNHPGRQAHPVASRARPVAPSALAASVPGARTPHGLTDREVRDLVGRFATAATVAREAGFDGVQVHAAHGYLISQFLSPLANTREDRYGGSLENRARFGLEILRRIKAEVPGLPVIFRIGVEDFFPGGLTVDEGIEVGRWAARDGADAVSVTAGHYRSLPAAERMIPPMAYPPATFLSYAARMKQVVDVPVIGVGRLGDPDVAARAVAERADFTGQRIDGGA